MEDKNNILLQYTADELLQKLASGDRCDTVSLPEEGSRKVLTWYLNNRSRWLRNSNDNKPKRISAEDVHEILASVKGLKGELRLEGLTAGPPQKILSRNTYTLVSMSAFRFAGLHEYAQPGGPENGMFRHEFVAIVGAGGPCDGVVGEPNVSLIFGKNGTGKSSLLNAICWALTGKISRPQHEHEDADKCAFSIQMDEDSSRIEDFIPVCSLPRYADIQNGQLPDPGTFVEIELRDNVGKTHRIRREVRRFRGKLKSEVRGMDAIGLSQQSINLSVLMPNLVQHIELGRRTTFDEALASLTGYRALQDLAAHAEKVQNEWLRRKLTSDANKAIVEKSKEYARIVREIAANTELCGLDDQDRDLLGEIAESSSVQAEQNLVHFRDKLMDRRTGMLDRLSEITGVSKSSLDIDGLRRLRDDVIAALGFYNSSTLEGSRIQSKWMKVASLTLQATERIQECCAEIVTEAKALIEMRSNQRELSRRQLFSVLGAWRRRNDMLMLPDSCPVCFQGIDGVSDPVLGQHVGELILKYSMQTMETRLLEKAFDEWVEDKWHQLNRCVGGLLDCEGDVLPHELLSRYGILDFFPEKLLSGGLGTLREQKITRFRALVDEIRVDFERKNLDSMIDLCWMPVELGRVMAALNSVQRIVQAVNWYQANPDRLVAIYNATVGGVLFTEGVRDAEQPISTQLRLINELALAIAPFDELVKKADAAMGQVRDYKEQLSFRVLCSEVVVAMDSLVSLGKLADELIAGTLGKIRGATLEWFNMMYVRSRSISPELSEPTIGVDGRLALTVRAGAIEVEAQHISNASMLRACLMAMSLALWEHVNRVQGGLSLLLFDDPQELFDADNRLRFAECIKRLAAIGAQPVLATNDYKFGQEVYYKCGGHGSDGRIQFLQIHPPSPVRPVAELGGFVADVMRKRTVFENSHRYREADPDIAAADYMAALRRYLEAALLDLLDGCSVDVAPTGLESIVKVLGQLKDRAESLGGPKLRELADHSELKGGSRLRKLMNQACHKDFSSITYHDVDQVKSECRKLVELVEASKQFKAELGVPSNIYIDDRRTTAILALNSARPVLPEPRRFCVPNIKHYGDLAAHSVGVSEGHLVESGDVLDVSWFEGKAVYQVQADTLGYVAPRGSCLIVSCADEEVQEGRLVVAVRERGGSVEWYARRLFRPPEQADIVLLAGESEDPRRRVTSVVASAAQVRLLKVVGVLLPFKGMKMSSRDQSLRDEGGRVSVQEVVGVDSEDELFKRITSVYRVTGDSARPVALDKQSVLVGKQIPLDSLDSFNGRIVALHFGDSQDSGPNAYALKRVGPLLGGLKSVRVFESVGSDGDPVVLHVSIVGAPMQELREGKFLQLARLQVLYRVFEVVGVLFDQSLPISPRIR